jgi:hypothetical protein
MTASFQRVGGNAAIGAAIAGFLDSAAFVLLARFAPDAAVGAYSFFLLIGGLLSSLALVGLWDRLRMEAPAWTLWAVAIGIIAAFGSAIHAGYDLANAIQPQGGSSSLPSQIDPRGLLTFGFAGLAVAAFSMLMRAAPGWPPRLVYLGFASAVLLVVIYLFRLVAPNSAAVLVPAALEGFIVNPIWYVWVGIELRRAG